MFIKALDWDCQMIYNIYSKMFKTQKSHKGTYNYITLKSEVSQLHNILIFKNYMCIYVIKKIHLKQLNTCTLIKDMK